MRKPVVFHIITKLELGGAQRVTLETLAQIDRDKYEVGLISGSEGELVEEALSLEGCRVHFLKTLKHPIRPLSDIRALFNIRKILRKENADIVHTHSSKAGIIGRWAAFFARVPVIVHSVHGWSFNDYQSGLKRSLYKFLEKITSRVTHHYFIESRQHIKKGIDSGIIRDENYSGLYPGIDFSEFDRVRRAKKVPLPPGLPNGRRKGDGLVTMIACFKPQKSPVDFVRAAELVFERRPGTRFLMVGDGRLRSEIEFEIAELNLGDKIILTGWRKDIPALMYHSDVIVLTSLWEGMPTVIPMAMRMKKPVVANRIDGCAELINHEVNGLLSEPGNVESISANVLRLLVDKKLAYELSHNAYKNTAAFEIANTTAAQEMVYEKLLKTFNRK